MIRCVKLKAVRHLVTREDLVQLALVNQAVAFGVRRLR